MKIGFNPGSIVDASGAPLQGRVLVYVHDSLEKKRIYTLQGSEYVASENPVLLDTTGRIPTTLFFDVGVVDVLVQKYVGEPGHLADESPDEDFEDFDRFEAGFDFDPEKEASRTVETIADLKDIENPSGVVRVNCYTTPGDTFPRYYLWNPNCTASEDGGCVIADTHDASGMWCYLCDGDSIKSSVYGIKPGTEETNLGAFCTAPLGVSGDYVITYPTTLYMEPGVYAYNASLSVTNGRKVIFSCKSKFTGAVFYLDEFDVDGRNTDYIANFYIENGHRRKSVEVHSSWFRDAFYLWSDFGVIYLESTNYFASNSFSSSVTVHNSTIIGNDAYYQPTFTLDGHLRFENCTFVGSKLFQHYGFKAIFSGCNFSDKLFYNMDSGNVDFGLLSQGHSIQVDSWQITDALNANVWIEWAKSEGKYYVDLQGRTIDGFVNPCFRRISNGTINGSVATEVDMELDNILGNLSTYPMDNSGKKLVLRNCHAVNIVNSAKFGSIQAFDSDLTTSDGSIDAEYTAFMQRGGTFNGSIVCSGWTAASGTANVSKPVNFDGCILQFNAAWFNYVTMRNCECADDIHVIPYYDTDDSAWKINAEFTCSVLNGDLVFTESLNENVDVYDVEIERLVIANCRFPSTGIIKMPYWANNSPHTFLKGDQPSVYKGNIGSNIPKEPYSASYDANAYFAIFATTYALSSVIESIWNTSGYTYCEYTNDCLYIKSDGSVIDGKLNMLHSSEREDTNDMFSVQKALLRTDLALMGSNAVVKVFGK